LDINRSIASKLSISLQQVRSAIELFKEDNTIPFIARYRKEQTGNLDEEQLRNIHDEMHRLENLEDRRRTVLQSIEEQGKLTDQLRHQILSVETSTALEDLYQPYRPKRRTKAMVAVEKGLEPLADLITKQVITDQKIDDLILPFITEEVPDQKSAIDGASDILAERISDNATIRSRVRNIALETGKITCEKRQDAEDDRRVFEMYYLFECPIRSLQAHQVLAINRGEKEEILRVNLFLDQNDWRQAIQMQYPPDPRSVFYEILIQASEDGANRLLLPAIERDIRRILTEQAEEHAIKVFATNLRALLLQAPLSDQTILAIDPGFRTGSKIAVINPNGNLLETATIYPHAPQVDKTGALKTLTGLIKKHRVSLIVIGNGTASRETEMLVSEITKKQKNLSYLITTEAGASVYSASKIARKEFPDIDVSIRGAISIGRRVQDPLAELVKIDPRSIGVGLYQHDIDQGKLSDALDQVVESVVNTVGVEVNTASSALLTHVAGIGPSLAEKIVKYREENGPFLTREDLNSVQGLGPKTFEQSIGFLRIRSGENPLDATAIHPESYRVAERILSLLDLPITADSTKRITSLNSLLENFHLNELSELLQIGTETLEDILSEIARPGRDPREDLPKPILRRDVMKMEDLTPGMKLQGTIRNVVDFGAFVDIGVKTDGLLHRSKVKRGAQLHVGEIIEVSILAIDQERNRISLEMTERP
jgi:uncharacterized protein